MVTIQTQSRSSYLLSPFYKNYLKKMLIIAKKNTVFGGGFNLIFDCKFDVSGGNPISKKKSLTKLTVIRETLYLCDIWRKRYPTWDVLHSGRSTFPVSLNEGLISNILPRVCYKSRRSCFLLYRSLVDIFFFRIKRYFDSWKRFLEI